MLFQSSLELSPEWNEIVREIASSRKVKISRATVGNVIKAYTNQKTALITKELLESQAFEKMLDSPNPRPKLSRKKAVEAALKAVGEIRQAGVK